MGAITGANTSAALVLGAISDNWGTAKAAGAGHKMRAEISPSFDAQELTAIPIGGGAIMTAESVRGRVTPTLGLNMDGMYDGAPVYSVAQIMGYSYAPVEVTTGQGDYKHRFTLAETANQVFLTAAYETSSTTTVELPTGTIRSVTTSFEETDNFLQVQAELLGNDVEFESAVNTNAVLDAATLADTDLVIAKSEDSFWINTETDGALDAGDLQSIIKYSRVINRPQDFSGELRGVAGNGEPIMSDVVGGTLTVTVKENANNNWFLAWQNGTKYKCKLDLKGQAVGTGFKRWCEYCPSMKLVSAPEYNLTEAGFNTVTLTFTLLSAINIPAGMGSYYPYFEITNTRSTVYIA